MAVPQIHYKPPAALLIPVPGTSLPQIEWEPPPPDFEIPDEPMDNTDQFLLADALKDALACAGRLSETDLLGVSLAVCAKISGRTVTKAPDWFYVPFVDSPTANRSSYTPIAEGARPAVVMEFLSDKKGREYDTSPLPPYGKWFFYEKVLEVPFYVIFNAKNGAIEVYRLEKGRYITQAGDENGRYWLDSMQLFLGVREGLKEDDQQRMFWLRWWDADGNLLPWQYELRKQEAVEKQAALEQAEKATTLRIARQMLQAQMDIAVIAQVTGLNEVEISDLDSP